MAPEMQKPAADPQDITPADDMQEIELRVGPGGGRTQRFTGRLLAESQQVTKNGTEIVQVFLSRKRKFVVHRQYIDWNDFGQHAKKAYQEKKDTLASVRNRSGQSELAMLGSWIKDMRNWRQFVGLEDGYGDFTLEVVDTLPEVRNLVPAKAYRIVADVVQNPSAQVLDI
ncbi:EXLDI protein [Nocardia crassostreae]|uniref:EXLDI protein n=1 Tax=Nocardia crassostreae TaxID=53428 RepID=UPI000B2500CE|nr:EXLDI protein [Nocardia crassostreae]